MPRARNRPARPPEDAMTKLLIVDDEQNVLYSLKKALAAEDRSIATAGTAGALGLGCI